ncbi:MAG: DUF5682 family protein [Agitococcus sp.]|nr:DUF5682 family protein [Agitococcus sp.]
MIQLFGIRHHGPGSARSVLSALTSLQPDIILLEGPVEAEAILPFATNPTMKPPVAVLVYGSVAEEAEPRAAFFPFAEFSPEWQAIQYGLQQDLPVRFIDLPQAYNLADNWQAPVIDESISPDNAPTIPPEQRAPVDPIGLLAQAAGYYDSERFWEHLVEQRPHAGEVFTAIHEAMSAVRSEVPNDDSPRQQRENCREAYMRQCLRNAEKEGFERIAVICGAWHTPALTELKKTKKDDTALLKTLNKIKTQAAWIPWTHSRLLSSSGYGAGIESPAWYQHLWAHYQSDTLNHETVTISWLAKVAQELRLQGLDASSAQLIDATRLISTLAALRGRELPDLDDLSEAIISVLHHGNDLPLQLSQKMLVGDVLGEVPDDVPTLPIQQDFNKQCKSLRLKPEADSKALELDLRKENDLARSQFLHRLNLLGIAWGQYASGGGRGSFKETWSLNWQPELSLKLLEAAIWGQSVNEATHNYLQQQLQQQQNIRAIAQLMESVLLANLSQTMPALIERIMALSAHSSEISTLITALEPLANTWRYSDVRQTNTDALAHVVSSFITRICIGLPSACSSLNDDAAQQRLDELKIIDRVLVRLEESSLQQQWHEVLLKLCQQQGLHGLLAGWCCRLAQDHDLLSAEAAAERFALALSQANSPEQAANWFAGFLTGQGLTLLHDDELWALVDNWLQYLSEEHFVQLLPLLRRTISTFSLPERQQIAAKVGGQQQQTKSHQGVDEQRANLVLPILSQILGTINPHSNSLPRGERTIPPLPEGEGWGEGGDLP